MQTPLVSVLVVTYNYGQFLGDCLDSVLQQRITGGMEIIVVDDGSTDNTSQVAERYPVRYFRLPHGGVAAARNFAVSQARGEWVAFIDADDLWTPDKLATQLTLAGENPDCNIVFCPVQNVTINQAAEDAIAKRGRALSSNTVHYLIPALIRRSMLLRVGPFPEHLGRGEDTYILCQMRLNRENMDVCLDRPCYLRRLHGENITLKPQEKAGTDMQITAGILRERFRKQQEEKRG